MSTAPRRDLPSLDQCLSTLKEKKKNFSKAGGDTVSELQSLVDEVKGVMTQNMEKVLERGDRLEADLMARSERLKNLAQYFQRTRRKISRRYWWKNKKMTLIICGVSLLVVIGGWQLYRTRIYRLKRKEKATHTDGVSGFLAYPLI